MSKEKEFVKDLEQAIKWVASEHRYFIELKEDLSKLKESLLSAITETSVKGIKAAFRSFRYLSKSERRLNHYIKDAKKIAGDVNKKLGNPREKEEFDEIVRRIDVEAAHLIKDASYYEGDIRDLIGHLEHKLKKMILSKHNKLLCNV